MTSSSSLYGSTPQTGNINSSNLTTLYSGNQSVVPNGNLVVPGTLTVNGCAILTNCDAFSLLPTTAQSIFFGGAATTMSIGSGTGVTTINNQLATANYTFPLADGSVNQTLVTDGAGTLYWAASSSVGKSYDIDATATTGGANFNLNSNLPTTDTIKFANGSNMTIVRTDANTITFTATDTNTTYAISSASTTGGANLTLTGSDSSTDSVAYKGSGATTVTSTDANTITISSTDTNTTYTQDVSSTTGGANLNLTGSDSTVDPVKFAGGTNVTVTATDANTITISTIADNIPDGTAQGEVLVWDGSQWTANNVVSSSASADRFVAQYINSDPGSNNALFVRKDYGATAYSSANNDGVGISYSTKSDSQGITYYGLTQFEYSATNPQFIIANSTDNFATVKNQIFIVDSTGAAISGDLDVRGGNITNSTGNLDITPSSGGLLTLSTDATSPTTITRNTTTTNANVRSLALSVQSSGTPTVGFGNSLEFQLEAQPSNTVRAGNVSVTSADLTAGSEDFDFYVNLMNNGAAAATRLKLDSYGILDTYRSTPDTNISTKALGINVNSTGTVAAGFGTAIGFSLEKADGNRDNSAFIDVVMTDATIGSEDYRMGFGLMQNGASNAYRMQLDSAGLLTTYGGIKTLGSTSGSSQFTAPSTGSTLTYVLPGSAGAANTVLTNDGSGNLSWALPGGGGSTFGNVTVGVVTDNTISTTTGDLVLASATNFLDASTLGADFQYISVDNQATVDSNSLTTTSTATVALNITARNAMTGLVNIIQGANVHCVNFTALRVDATTALLTTFGEMYNTSSLASFTADVSGGNLRLLITPASATSTTFSCVRTSLT